MKRGSLLKGSKFNKPQCKFSSEIKANAKSQVSEWLQEFGLVEYQSNLLAGELIDRAINKFIASVSPTAPDVYLSEADKISGAVMSAKKIADTLDEEGKLEELLGELENKNSRREGNSL